MARKRTQLKIKGHNGKSLTISDGAGQFEVEIRIDSNTGELYFLYNRIRYKIENWGSAEHPHYLISNYGFG